MTVLATPLLPAAGAVLVTERGSARLIEVDATLDNLQRNVSASHPTFWSQPRHSHSDGAPWRT